MVVTRASADAECAVLVASGLYNGHDAAPRPGVPWLPTAAARRLNVQAQWAGTDAHGAPRGVILTWSPVAGATSYTVYRGTIIAPRPAGLATVLRRGVTATAFVDPEVGMGVDTITFYQVTAVNAAATAASRRRPSPGLVTSTVPVVVQGTLVQVSGPHLWLKTPTRGRCARRALRARNTSYSAPPIRWTPRPRSLRLRRHAHRRAASAGGPVADCGRAQGAESGRPAEPGYRGAGAGAGRDRTRQ